jgi:outer membrane protein OmpA-like peptidoglycan-associated protein
MTASFVPRLAGRLAGAALRFALVCGLLVPSAAGAVNPWYNIDSFRPSPYEADLLGVYSNRMPDPMTARVSLWSSLNAGPLRVIDNQNNDVFGLVNHQLAFHLMGSIGLLQWLQVGVDAPFYAISEGDTPNVASLRQAEGYSLGDLAVTAKAAILGGRRPGMGLGLATSVTLPTATARNFTGDEGLTATTWLVADAAHKGFQGALNVGYRARTAQTLLGHELGNQIVMGAAAAVPVVCGKVEVLASGEFRTEAGRPFDDAYVDALDLLAGVRALLGPVAVTAGGGFGPLEGYGSSAWRAVLGASMGPAEVDKGCIPDTDEDGLHDPDDRCPTAAGPLTLGGCPDRDGDKIADRDDKCPTVAGLVHFDGCPDTDGDMLADPDDRCPSQAGPTALQGCPDRDGDEVADLDDPCPDVQGLKEKQGCPEPDRDGDGVPDIRDRCPDLPGPATQTGCPDRDADGVVDPDDKCPDEPGSVANAGCLPDADGDGVPDVRDKCIDVPGTPVLQGCPEAKVTVSKDKIYIADQVFFQTGKAKIKPESFGLLDEVARVLKEHPEIKKLRIEGHTDNVGKPEANAKLSKARAASVRDYLVKKQVAAKRLESAGFGDSRPVVDNSTEQGRARNRRVDFVITERAD